MPMFFGKRVPPPVVKKVTLKSVAGIRPVVYVPVIWLVLLAAVFFMLLIRPGIRRNGTMITVLSVPSGVSVLADGVRLGTSGEPLFVERGIRQLTVRKNGFETYSETIEVEGRVLASVLFPRTRTISVALVTEQDYSHLAAGARDFAGWTATGPQQGRYALPPVLTQSARDSLAWSWDDISPRLSSDPEIGAFELAKAVLPLSQDERHLADLFRAEYLISTNGMVPGIGSLVTFTEELSRMMTPDMLSGIQALGGRLQESADSAQLLSADAYDKIDGPFPQLRYGETSFAGIPKVILPVGDLERSTRPRQGAVPVLAAAGPFFISETEVTEAEFNVFLSDRPEWAADARETLKAQSLADERYLTALSGGGQNPVSAVSWYAADAYAEWFTERYLSGSGYTARLPREDEWEIAARLNGITGNTMNLPAGLKTADSADSGVLGIRGMGGNLREWCLNPYRFNENLFRPADGTPSYQDPLNAMSSAMRPVRGGAWIDGDLETPSAVRGGLSAETASSVVGFRLVIVPAG